LQPSRRALSYAGEAFLRLVIGEGGKRPAMAG